MATLADLSKSINVQFPGKVVSLVCAVENEVSRVDYDASATEADKAAIQAAITAFNWTKPSEDLPLFFELFAKETMLGTFTAEQHGTMKLLADIKQDVAFRTQALLNAMASGTPAQKSKLLDIAAQSGLSLPLP